MLLSLVTAVRDGVRVRVDYERADGERFERRLEPRRVLSMEGRWYLFAWDLEREDWRTFRLDRMHEVSASTLPITDRPVPDIEAAVRESITVSSYPTACTVRILAPYDQIAPHVPARSGTLEADGEDACVLRAGADDLTWVALHLARIGAPVEVIDPPALLEEIERLGRWAASAGPGSTGPTGAGPSGAGPAGAGPGTTAPGSER